MWLRSLQARGCNAVSLPMCLTCKLAGTPHDAGTPHAHHRSRAALPVGLFRQDCGAGQPGGAESQVSSLQAANLVWVMGTFEANRGPLREEVSLVPCLAACRKQAGAPCRVVQLPPVIPATAGTGRAMPRRRFGSCVSSWSSSRRSSSRVAAATAAADWCAFARMPLLMRKITVTACAGKFNGCV